MRTSLRSGLGAARNLTKLLAPGLYRRVSFHRNEGRLRRIAQKIIRRFGPVVVAGPFKGMKLTPTVAEAVYNPMLVGCYEAELETVIETVITRNYDLLVDIGCAQGYYAVGLLLRMPKSRCVAFDMDETARRLCRDMGKINAVCDRLETRGRCEAAELDPILSRRAFILCDCEGAELELLDPASVPALACCDILVELHDFIVPAITQTIVQRFHTTHAVQIIEAVQKEPSRYSQLSFLNPKERAMAVREHRPAGMRWAWLQTKATP